MELTKVTELKHTADDKLAAKTEAHKAAKAVVESAKAVLQKVKEELV